MITVFLLENKSNKRFNREFYSIEKANKFLNKVKYSKKITYLGMVVDYYD